jgi:hypothetical protein
MTERQMSDQHASSRGQVLVIFAGGLLALLAIAALVVDIGSVLWIQRQERNAADPGAIAAARYIKFSSGGPMDCIAPYNGAQKCDMYKAACAYAKQNGFFQTATDATNKATGCVAANDRSQSTLAVSYPPSTNAGQFAGRPGFVEVSITRPHRSIISGLFGITTYTVSSNAVASLSDGDSNSNSLLVLNPHQCGSLTILGNGSIAITGAPGVNGGYIMVNSDCGQAGDTTQDVCVNGSAGASQIGGNGTVSAPHLYVVGSCQKNGNPTITWGTSPGVTEDANFYGDPLTGLIGPPASGQGAMCEPLARRLVPGDGGCAYSGNTTFTLDPGVYYGGIKVNTPNVKLIMNPGIYIMGGGGFNPSNGSIDSQAGDVLIYATDVEQYRGANCASQAPNGNYCQGDILINGQVKIDLQALSHDPCPPVSSSGCPYAGMLFWMDRTSSKALAGTAQIVINGGSDVRLAGTVYNPLGHVQLNGGSGVGCTGLNQSCMAIQIIADTVTLNGGNTTVLPYDPAGLYHLDNKGLVK